MLAFVSPRHDLSSSDVLILFMVVIFSLASFFVKWPDTPVEPSSIAGAMYYMCDTSVTDRFEGLSTLSKM